MKRRIGPAGLRDAVAVLGTFLILGVACGVAWLVLVEPAHLVRAPGGFQAPSELDLARRFNPDGWYAVIAIVAGFVSGLAITWWRSRDFLLTTLLLLPGSAVAAATMALVGRALGPVDPHQALSDAARGQVAPMELSVTADAVYLAWPVATLLGALMVLWSSPGTPAGNAQSLDPEFRDKSLPNTTDDHHRSGL